jgi:all-trans-retinol 13,14-reductase
MKQYEVVLVGSGISSLTAALILAKRGKKVCVLEQYKKPGGYLHSFKRFSHVYETGAHYAGALEPGQPFHTLLSYLGIYDPDLFIPLDPSGFDVFSFPDFEYAFPKGYAAIVDSLSTLFPTDAKGIDDYFRTVQTTVRDFQTYHYSLKLDLGRLLEGLDLSLGKAVRSRIQTPRLQTILFGHCYLHGVQPDDISFSLHALVLDSILRGSCGFRLGGDAMAKRFTDQIEAHGGEIRTASRVVKLHAEQRTATEVELFSGERIRAKQFISGAHPRETFRWVDRSLVPDVFSRRLEKLRESEAIFGVYADMEHQVGISRLRNYYFFSSSHPQAFLKVNEPSETPSMVFVCRPDRQAGSELDRYPLTFHAPGPYRWFSEWEKSTTGRRAPEYKNLKQNLAEKVIGLVDSRVPGLRHAVKRFETSTALTNVFYNGSNQGSGYGIYHSMDATGMRALGPRTRLKNLFLTGQNTLIPGLLGAATSGLRTAGELVGLDSLLTDLIRLRDA